jgi:hypothetical protein
MISGEWMEGGGRRMKREPVETKGGKEDEGVPNILQTRLTSLVDLNLEGNPMSKIPLHVLKGGVRAIMDHLETVAKEEKSNLRYIHPRAQNKKKTQQS